MENSIENRLSLLEARIAKLEAIEKRRRIFGIIKLVISILLIIGSLIAVWFAYSHITKVIDPYREIIDSYNDSDLGGILEEIG